MKQILENDTGNIGMGWNSENIEEERKAGRKTPEQERKGGNQEKSYTKVEGNAKKNPGSERRNACRKIIRKVVHVNEKKEK